MSYLFENIVNIVTILSVFIAGYFLGYSFWFIYQSLFFSFLLLVVMMFFFTRVEKENSMSQFDLYLIILTLFSILFMGMFAGNMHYVISVENSISIFR